MNKIAQGVLLALGGTALLASQAVQAQEAQRVEVTGSNIKRTINDEGALPITVLKASELREAGVTTVEGIIQLLASSQSSNVSSNSIGSGTGGATYANLRGLGTNKTLVLLNGRRIAAFAFAVNAVDLNSIPFAVIDRVEVLRDGASAIYGTDAIGGVINFITKKNFEGGAISAEFSKPQAHNGDTQRMTATFGGGDLQKDKVNAWFSIDTQRNGMVDALDRDFAKTGIIPSKGVNGNSPTTFPGNFTQNSTNITGNLTAPNCAPPLSVVNPSNSKACVFDFSATISIIPLVSQDTAAARVTTLLPGNHTLTLEGLSTTNRNVSRVAPDPVSSISIAPGNPYYPSSYPGLDTSKAVTVAWRMIPAGGRTNESISQAERLVLDLQGTVAGFDYRAGLFYTDNTAQDGAIDGYVNAPFVRSEVAAGRLNPFGDATPAQLAVIEQAKRRGTFALAEGTTKGLDFRASRDLFAMGGGQAAMSVGAEFRQEFYRNDSNDDVVLAIPSAGRSVNHVKGDRRVTALSAELLLPVTKSLEVSLAVRSDDYSDAGRSTNPKIGLRFQPMQGLLMRGSYNTGFKAPTLDDLYAPQTVTFATGASNDPLLCPGGKVNTAAGGVTSRDCANQAQIQQGGNPNLKPEKSKTASLGLVIEPARGLVLSADYFNIKLTNQINALPWQSIIADPALYAGKYVRCKELSPSVQANLNRCGADNLNSNAIAYLIALSDNLGKVNTSGVDFSASYQTAIGTLGNFAFNWDGTWIKSYKYQLSPTDPLKESVGAYVDGSPVFRWQHTVSLGWSKGDLSARLGIRNKTGYTDMNSPATVVGGPSFYQDVKSYTLVDVSVTARPTKKLSVTAGIKNLLDTDPPFSNQSDRSQRGYDPRYTDPMGRTLFVRGSYTF
jgi:iron complex outermembrane receptor protein